MSSKLKFLLIFAGFVLLAFLYVRLTMYKYVEPNEVGIWMTNGGRNGVSDYEVRYGRLPIDFNPLTKSFTIPAQPWTIDLPQRVVYSQQNGEWVIDPQFTFRVNKDQAPLVCFANNNLLNGPDSNFLNAVGKHLLTLKVNDVINEIVGSNRDTFLLTNKVLVGRMFEDSVRARFYRHGYLLDAFTSGITPPKSIIETNRAKNLAEQSVYTARANGIKAEADAKVNIITAESAAKVKLIEAQAEAQSVKLKEQSLSPLMIQQMWIDKWDGALPYYQAGSNTSMMMQMPK